MSKNLPQKYKEGIFYRIKRFFTNLFSKINKKTFVSEEIVNNEENASKDKKTNQVNYFKKSLFEENVSKENYETGIKKSIVDIVENKPELIQTMSNENLKKLVKIYDELIKENEMKIQILTKKA